MRVCILLFGPHAAALGADRAELELAGTPTAGAVQRALSHEFPSLRPLLAGARIAVNGEFVGGDHPIVAADELALIGLVSGG
jgi:sulfur-carrier protein